MGTVFEKRVQTFFPSEEIAQPARELAAPAAVVTRVVCSGITEDIPAESGCEPEVSGCREVQPRDGDVETSLTIVAALFSSLLTKRSIALKA